MANDFFCILSKRIEPSSAFYADAVPATTLINPSLKEAAIASASIEISMIPGKMPIIVCSQKPSLRTSSLEMRLT